MMRHARLWLVAGMLVGAGQVPLPAAAQYFFMDTNGNGMHDAGDVLPSSGIRAIDLYLATDVNADSTPAVCPTGEPLDINSYVILLEATGGSVRWVSYANS